MTEEEMGQKDQIFVVEDIKTTNEELNKSYRKLRESLEKEVEGWKLKANQNACSLEKQKEDYDEKVVAVETITKKMLELESESRLLKVEVDCLKTIVTGVVAEKNEVIDKLKEKVECPVCLDIPRKGPVFVCPNGHTVCSACKRDTCPSCRENMGSCKSLLALTVIENVKHKCKFACGNSSDLYKLDEHEQICAHRIVSCPHSICNEKVNLSKLKEHAMKSCCFDGDKPVLLDYFPRGHRRRLKYSEGNGAWDSELLEYKGASFGLLVEKVNSLVLCSIVLFGLEKDCSNFKINVEAKAINCEDSENKFIFSGTPGSIDMNKEDLKYQGLVINKLGMKKLPNKEKEFSLSVKIEKK